MEDALAALGFSWQRLQRLARTALHDEMRRRRIHLDDDRYLRACEFYEEVAARWAFEYDPALAGGVSYPSSAYRRMRPRLIDFLRNEHGDQRRGTPLFQVPTEQLPQGTHQVADVAPGFDEEIEELAGRLPARARWTLEHLGRPIAELELSLAEAADRAGIEVEYAQELLEELGWRLGHDRPVGSVDATSDFAHMQAWCAA